MLYFIDAIYNTCYYLVVWYRYIYILIYVLYDPSLSTAPVFGKAMGSTETTRPLVNEGKSTRVGSVETVE